MTTPKRAKRLHAELRVIAGDELAGPLERWDDLTREDAAKLHAYLIAELEGYGMLSTAKARENGTSLSRERAEAKRLLPMLQDRMKVRTWAEAGPWGGTPPD